MLTKKEHRLLEFIITYHKGNGGLIPSIREMAVGLEYPAHSPLHVQVSNLIKKGYLSRNATDRGRWRAMKIEKYPDGRGFGGSDKWFPGMRVVETNAVPENEIWVREAAALDRMVG